MRLAALKPLVLCLVAGLSVTVFNASAFAQGGGGGRGLGGGGGMFGGGMGGGMFGGMGQMTGAPVTKTDVDKMTKFFSLTADQQTAAQALLDGHTATFQKKADEVRKAQEEAREAFRESRDFTVFTDLQPRMEELRKARVEMQRAYFEDVKGVLDKKQVERFPQFERNHKREQSMGRGLMSGERADVAAIVERMTLSDAQRKMLEPVLEQYGVELDRAIDVRNAAQEKMTGGQMDWRSIMDPDGDPAARKKMEDMINENRTASTAVRDINRKYARQIETTLGGAEGEKFAAEFRKGSFPDIYRERSTDRALSAAAAIEGLDASQKDGVKALADQYARDLKPLNEAGEKAAEEREANFSLQNMMNWRGQGDAGQDLRRQRRELEDSVYEKLKTILTPEQFAKLPERGGQGGGEEGAPRRQRGNGQGGAGGGGGMAPDGNNSGGDTPRRPRTPRNGNTPGQGN